QWEDMRVLETATLQHHRSMNPCPLYDEFTGTLFLFFITVLGRTPEAYQIVTGQNVTRLCCVTSADQGLSWSTATDLTQQVIGATIKGTQLGVLGEGGCDRSGECQLVSVDEEDGSNVLYCNARSPLGFRVQALSTDDGAVFHGGQLVQRLVEPPHGCHGSVIGFPAPLVYVPTASRDTGMPSRGLGCRLLPWAPRSVTLVQGDSAATPSPTPFFQAPTWILYSHPTSPMSRVNMGVHLSTFPRDAESWTEPWVIYEGPSAYSDLAYLELPQRDAPVAGGTAIAFACLYENGTRSPYEQISFSMFTLHDVLQNIPLTAAAPPRGRGGKRKRRRSCFIS
ncbi:NEUR4 protein, partial [Emberiza fucata]|nr:NEUR4 protein [Emberiza fucata]